MTTDALVWTGSEAGEECAADLAYQDVALKGVSRTFALTIPQLPPHLMTVVGNAYLLCRIADTIEDCETLSFEQKQSFYEQFIAILSEDAPPEPFAQGLAPLLAEAMSREERDLIANTGRVVRITRRFSPVERKAIVRCVRIMSSGMEQFQKDHFAHGLRDLPQMDAYCYHVAGVVGEMLTELFCAYSPEAAKEKDRLWRLSVSFGQGLQMTNILKDIWDDQERGVCWLPRDVFADAGFNLDDLAPGCQNEGFERGLERLIAVAHGHLQNALAYTMLLPKHEEGMRQFCLWALGMAVLTLDRINSRRDFNSGQDVKISRRAVRATILASRLCGRSNVLLKGAFRFAARRLPAAPADVVQASR